jgi:superfamily II DNA or RNA helicase
LSSEPASFDRAKVKIRLGEILTETPGLNASELGRILGLHKSDLNPILYNSELFYKSEDTKPKWFFNPDATEVELPVKKKSKPNVRRDIDEAPPIDLSDYEPMEEEEIDPEQLARFFKKASGERPTFRPIERSEANPFGLYPWQQEALAAWELWGHQGIVDAVTGAGKTRLAIAAIAKHLASGGRSVVIVPTIVLLHQWADILREAIPSCSVGKVGDGEDDDLRDFDVVVAVVASARNRVFRLGGAEGLLVVDECHRSASEHNQRALDENFSKRLGLSATHERMDKAHETVLLPYFKRVIYTLDYERAINDGVITNVRVAFIGVNFSEEEMAIYQKLVRELQSLRRKLIREFGVRPAPFSVFLDDVVRLTGGGPGTMKGGIAANRWLTMWRQKRELLAETPSKQLAIAQLTGALRDADRALLFTQSIASANTISQLLIERGVNCEPHHSEISTEEREGIMNRFADGEIKALASVQTLEEGVDVPDADLAVIVASSKQRRQMIQRMGRVMRRKADGRDARFIILYVNNTDEDPLRGAHELFIEELLAVARESSIFDLTSQVDEMRDFLDPGRR